MERCHLTFSKTLYVLVLSVAGVGLESPICYREAVRVLALCVTSASCLVEVFPISVLSMLSRVLPVALLPLC